MECIEELRLQWTALLESDTLRLMPTEALIASIKNLAEELLIRTAQPGTSLRERCHSDG
jgi:hypothetical protein